MKLIIAGSRTISITVEELDALIIAENITDITEVVSGCAKGMDKVGINWAVKNNIPVKMFIPDWSVGKAAGHIRNREMGDYADQAIVVYNGSAGSAGMIDYMKKINKKCAIIFMEKPVSDGTSFLDELYTNEYANYKKPSKQELVFDDNF
jgi:hypothetical protein